MPKKTITKLEPVIKVSIEKEVPRKIILTKPTVRTIVVPPKKGDK